MRLSHNVLAKAGLMFVLLFLLQLPSNAQNNAYAANVLHVPGNFATIQSAVGEAQPGDIIQVSNGTFSENVTIDGMSDIRLQGSGTTLDGSGVGGTGIGIHISNSTGIRVQGFVVEGFEAGIVLEGTNHSRVHNVETRFNDSDTSSLRDGLQLVASNHNLVSNVHAHGNGHNGITLKKNAEGEGSSNNTLRGNTANDNGQNAEVAANFGGCGIQLIGSGNHDNRIAANEVLRNGWGIQVGSESNGNNVAQNRSHENQRAGIVILNLGENNFIGQNNATGNGIAGMAPSGAVDLFDQGDVDNTWRNNKGTSNF